MKYLRYAANVNVSVLQVSLSEGCTWGRHLTVDKLLRCFYSGVYFYFCYSLVPGCVKACIILSTLYNLTGVYYLLVFQWNITVKPTFPEDSDNLSLLVPFEERVKLESGNPSFVKCPEYLLLTNNGRTFKYPIFPAIAFLLAMRLVIFKAEYHFQHISIRLKSDSFFVCGQYRGGSISFEGGIALHRSCGYRLWGTMARATFQNTCDHMQASRVEVFATRGKVFRLVICPRYYFLDGSSLVSICGIG